MTKKIFICGAFGYRDNLINGQSMKTRVLREELEKIEHLEISYFDTCEFRNTPVRSLRQIFLEFRKADHVFILPGINGLRVLMIYYVGLKLVFKKKLHYIVIGGWLPDLLKKNFILRFLCRKNDHLFVETQGMKRELTSFGFNNTVTSPNFKSIYPEQKIQAEPIFSIDDGLRLFFLSRVCAEKGVERAIEAVAGIHSSGKFKIKLDIFGPIQPHYQRAFFEKISSVGECVEYKGVLDSTDPFFFSTLSKYHFMLFPTEYSGEGFPGVVVDSFIAGVPVIGSNWRYNSELITEKDTGYLYEIDRQENLSQVIVKAWDNIDTLSAMRAYCRGEATKYDSKKIIENILVVTGLMS